MKLLMVFLVMMMIGPIIFAVNLFHKNSTATKTELIKGNWICAKKSSVVILVSKAPVVIDQCDEYKRIKDAIK